MHHSGNFLKYQNSSEETTMKKVLIPIMLIMTGCQTIQDNPYISPFVPELSFDRLQVNYIDFQQIDTEFVFAIDNPNPVGFDIDSFSYGLSFSGIEFLNGDNSDGLLMEAMNTSEVSLPAELIFADLYNVVQSTRGEDSLPFRLDGDFGLNLDGVFEEDTLMDSYAKNLLLPYDVQGDFPALRRPRFSLQRLQLQNISLQQIDLDLIIDVDNEHASNLIFQRFSYDIHLGGNSIISGIVDNLGEIIHGSEHNLGETNRTLRIPISIDATNTVLNLWETISSKQRLNIDFSAISDVETPFGLVELQINERGDVDLKMQ
jgi:hypothetical protein